MIVRTLTESSRQVKTKATCAQCKKRYKPGEIALIHDFGTKAAWDLREFTLHALCSLTVMARAGLTLDNTEITIPNPRAEAAAEFSAHIERIRAGGPVLI